MTELVSCLMVTRDRVELARRAVDCFVSQTWSDTELVIVDDGDTNYGQMLEPYVRRGHRIRYHRLEAQPGWLLGELRNISIDLAAGDWCIQWDDDEWYHPERIATQMRARGNAAAVALKWTLLDVPTKDRGRLAFRGDSGIATPGTVLHHRHAARYPNLARNEDGVFLADARRKGLVVLGRECSHLFVRCFHGTNTWDQQHFLRRLRRRPVDWLPYVVASLTGDLRRHPAFRLEPREVATIDALRSYRPHEVTVP
ncbi:MAG: glycosyltransferase family 2 protein [Acidobacteria bacterium]|nr:glycosyltransferase family 2 protein [Acidobacteriota bacterium]